MIQISKQNNIELYTDYKKCYDFLQNIKEEEYTYPEEKTIFHIYSELKTEKELQSVRSFFATQNLDKTQLYLWSDYDISNLECLVPFKKLITFKIYNPTEEAKGTILESELSYLLARDSKYYIQSDLLRILALHKYGGVWIDMDIILLRDFKPILDQEYMYQWGDILDFENEGACGSVLSVKKNSEFSNRLINGILTMPIWYNCTILGKNLFAKLYKESPFTVFPTVFFNIEWIIGSPIIERIDGVPSKWFDQPCEDEFLFTDCFSWHWHNSSTKNKQIKKYSKFYKLTQFIDKKLKNKGFI